MGLHQQWSSIARTQISGSVMYTQCRINLKICIFKAVSHRINISWPIFIWEWQMIIGPDNGIWWGSFLLTEGFWVNCLVIVCYSWDVWGCDGAFLPAVSVIELNLHEHTISALPLSPSRVSLLLPTVDSDALRSSCHLQQLSRTPDKWPALLYHD